MDHSLASVLSSTAMQPQVGGERISVADAVVRCMAEAGIKHVFGVPGGTTIPLHTSIDDVDEIDFVLTAHEGGASYMADCYARITGRISACCATTGPGATNLLTGIASARQDSVPMLVITGMNPMDTWGRGDFQECSPFWLLDTVKMFSSVCKLSEVVVSEKTVLHRLKNAITTALRGRPGPVHLAIPRDLWSKEIRYEPMDIASLVPHVPAPSLEAMSEVIAKLAVAKHPLIIFGSGATDEAVEALFYVSEIHGIPIVSTPRAKGKWFRAASPYYLGSMGISATPVVDTLFENTDFDFVLSVGAGFGSYATNNWDPLTSGNATMAQVNIDPNEIGRNYPADIGIVSDGAAFAKTLQMQMGTLPTSEQVIERRKWAKTWTPGPRWPLVEFKDDASAQGVHPQNIIRAVDSAVGRGGIILADSSSILLWATHYLPDRAERRFVSVWGWASMGHVTAGAIGAQLADPDAGVVVLTGDGCFLMNGNEISTAVALKQPIVWVVNVNAQLGMIHYELRGPNKTKSATLRRHDFVGFALSLGAHGVCCRDSSKLADLIAQGLKKNLPTVIQVDTDPLPVPPMGNKKVGGARWREHIAGI